MDSFFERHPDLKRFLYVAMGDESDVWKAAMKEFTCILERGAPKGLDWHSRFYRSKGHGAETHLALYDALEKLFDGFGLPEDVLARGSEAVEEHYQALSKRFGFRIEVPEVIRNAMGYALLQEKRIEEAIEVFRRNVEAYPGSWNVYDSLGEAYMLAGETERAEALYEKSLTLNPQNENGRKMLARMRGE
jgi:tetratricopeptide (TPR) repeat protein